MYSKSTSRIEMLRKPVSRMLAVFVASAALFTAPKTAASTTVELLEMAGFGLLIAAALGRIWCGIYISGRKNTVLCTDGPYSLCRNPLYFFSFLGVAGFALALESLFLFAVCTTGYLILYRFIIASEERRLSALFGTSYVDYLATVPRFLPRLKRPTQVDSISIQPRILEKSLKEVVWFLLAIIAVEVLEMIHGAGHLVLGHTPF